MRQILLPFFESDNSFKFDLYRTFNVVTKLNRNPDVALDP